MPLTILSPQWAQFLIKRFFKRELALIIHISGFKIHIQNLFLFMFISLMSLIKDTFIIAKSIFVDAFMRNPGLQLMADSSIGDFIWYSANYAFPLHLFADTSSKSAFSQGLAAVIRSYRFLHSGITGNIDNVFSSAVSYVLSNPNAHKNSDIRQYKRFLLTQTRNNGIYKDLGEIMISCLNQNKSMNEILTSKDIDYNELITRSSIEYLENSLELPEKQREFSFNKVKKIFKEETNYDFDEVFRAVSETPNILGSGRVSFDAILKTGEDVSIQMFNPVSQRMRTYDANVLYYISFLFNFSRYFGKKFNLRYLLRQLNYTIADDVKGRITLLESLGIDLSQAPKDLFSQVEKLRFPIQIPAPLTRYSSKNLMVTDRQPFYQIRRNAISNESISKIFKAASYSLFDHNILIPNLMIDNIKSTSGQKQISLKSFSSIEKISINDIRYITDLFKRKDKKFDLFSSFYVSSDTVSDFMLQLQSLSGYLKQSQDNDGLNEYVQNFSKYLNTSNRAEAKKIIFQLS